MTSEQRRTTLAVVVSPAVLPAVVGAYGILKGWGAAESLTMAAIYGVFTYTGTVALGLPVHVLLTRFGLQSVWYYATAGALLGVMMLAAFFLINPNMSVGMVSVLVFATFGSVTAAVFWRLARPLLSSQ